MKITTTALTEQGAIALRQAVQENKIELQKYTPEQRKTFYNTWLEIFTDNKDLCKYTLLLKVRSALGSSYYITKRFNKSVDSAKCFNEDVQKEFAKMANEINTAMQKNGATENVDFTTEIQQ